MKFLIFDTETTGLPIRKDDYEVLKAQSVALPVQYNPNGSPRLAQLSWQLVDENDVTATRRCLMALISRRVIEVKGVEMKF